MSIDEHLKQQIFELQNRLHQVETLRSIATDSTYHAFAGRLGREGCAPFDKHQLFSLRESYHLVISDGSGGPVVYAIPLGASPDVSRWPVQTWGEAFQVIYGKNAQQKGQKGDRE